MIYSQLDFFASAVPVISLTKQWMGSCLGLTGNQPMTEEALSFQSFTTYLDWWGGAGESIVELARN